MSSWFGGLFTSAGGATAPREENLKPKAPTATRNNSGNSGKNTVLTVAPADPNATKLKVVPHPTASAPAAAPAPATQQGGRRSAKGRKTKGKSRGRKSKSKKRSTRK